MRLSAVDPARSVVSLDRPDVRGTPTASPARRRVLWVGEELPDHRLALVPEGRAQGGYTGRQPTRRAARSARRLRRRGPAHSRRAPEPDREHGRRSTARFARGEHAPVGCDRPRVVRGRRPRGHLPPYRSVPPNRRHSQRLEHTWGRTALHGGWGAGASGESLTAPVPAAAHLAAQADQVLRAQP